MITAAMESKQTKVTITCLVVICTELLVIVYLWSSQEDVFIVGRLGQPLPFQTVPELHSTEALPPTMKDADQPLPLETVAELHCTETLRPTIEDVLNYQLKSPLVLTVVNHAFLGLFVNLLTSIQRIKLQSNSKNSSNLQPFNMFVICEDKMSFDEVSKNPPNVSLKYVTALSHLGESASTPMIHGSEVYLKLVQKRVSYIELLLRNNIDVLFVDSDVVLLEDPFKYFNGTEDLFIQRERASAQGTVCTGFFYMRANDITRQFVSAWKRALPRDKKGNQDAFNIMLRKFQNKMKVKRLPVDRFPSGHIFMKSNLSWQMRKPRPVEVHANFLKGVENKTAMLKRFDLWFSTSKYEKE